ncbi:transposable element Tc1 transposase [Trichonephila clavipes]|nr:transposable element Tc1 transposase [Trichonephila clavipes]
MITGAHFSGASMSRKANLVGFSRTLVSRVMKAYTDLGKVSSEKRNSGRKLNRKDRDRRGADEDSPQDYTTIDNVSEIIPSERGIHESYLTGVASCDHSWKNSYFKTVNFSAECYEKTALMTRSPKLDTTVMKTSHLSDESSVTLFQTTGREFVWRTLAQEFHVDCTVPTVNHEGDSVTV